MNKLKKTVIILLVILLICNNKCTINATDKTSLQNEQSETEQKIDEAKQNLEQIEEEKSEALKSIAELTEQINEYDYKIEEINEEISNLNQRIIDEEENLKVTQEEYEKQFETLQTRIVAVYQSGQISYLDVLLNSTSLTSLISNYYLVSQIAEHDQELLKTIEQYRISIEDSKVALESNKQEVENKKTELEIIQNSLQIAKNSKKIEVNNLTNEEKEIQADLDKFEEDKKDIEEKLKEIARKEAEEAKRKAEEAAAAAKKAQESTTKNTNNSTSSSSNTSSTSSVTASKSGYIFPVAGLSKNNINNKSYPSYTGHTGVDININVVGKSVVAVKDGTVEISTSLKNSNGSYRSYGEYIVINHHDGTMTLYAHGLENSRKVEKGQTVKQGQVIMTVGNTGNSKGTHLHFEVRVNAKPVNPLPYLP